MGQIFESWAHLSLHLRKKSLDGYVALTEISQREYTLLTSHVIMATMMMIK